MLYRRPRGHRARLQEAVFSLHLVKTPVLEMWGQCLAAEVAGARKPTGTSVPLLRERDPGSLLPTS